jgi:hypothetical protein
MGKVAEATLTEVRSRIVGELAERFPATRPARRVTKETLLVRDGAGRIVGMREVEPADGGDPPLMAILSAAEMTIAAEVGYATRASPGVIAFDYGLVERAIGRRLTALDIRVLREAAVAGLEEGVDERLATLVSSVEAYVG